MISVAINGLYCQTALTSVGLTCCHNKTPQFSVCTKECGERGTSVMKDALPGSDFKRVYLTYQDLQELVQT